MGSFTSTSNFDAFTKDFQGDIVTPTHPEYPASITRWASSAERRAKVIAFVKSNEDVARAIKYARADNLSIAVRGGGHNPSGASSCEDGVVIDLSKYMKATRIDQDNKIAYVGGGAMWEDVDKATIKLGLAAVAGTMRNIGVGGFTLGGGLGWLTPAHGLAIDNLIQATVVTANGNTYVASEAENPDLFFGIRGGGCNFGAVTEFVFHLHSQRPTVYSGILTYPLTAIDRIIDVTNEWFPHASEKESMMQEFAVLPDGTPAVRLVPFYNGPQDEGREKFKAFFEIGPISDHTFEIPYDAVNSDLMPGGKGIYMTGVRQKNHSAEAIKKCIDICLEAYREHQMLPFLYCEFVPLNKVNTVATDKTAFRRVTSQGISIVVQWDGESVLSPSFDAQVRDDKVAKARSIAHKLTSTIASAQPKTGEPFYLGYANIDCDTTVDKMYGISSEEKTRLTFGENYTKLQAIKKRYDPDNIFNKWFPITPAQ